MSLIHGSLPSEKWTSLRLSHWFRKGLPLFIILPDRQNKSFCYTYIEKKGHIFYI